MTAARERAELRVVVDKKYALPSMWQPRVRAGMG
jgi:hypothetical protein